LWPAIFNKIQKIILAKSSLEKTCVAQTNSEAVGERISEK